LSRCADTPRSGPSEGIGCLAFSDRCDPLAGPGPIARVAR